MRARGKKTPRLREMHPTRALAYCVNLTRQEWITLGQDETVSELWPIIGAYIRNGYNDIGITVPAQIEAVWSRCKVIIDREAGL